MLAGVAQLVERKPSKLDVAGSSPVSRSEGTCNGHEVWLQVSVTVTEPVTGYGAVYGSR